MELKFLINLTLIFLLNVFFFFSGIFLNSLVILTFWKSARLRNKLCYFMIMVLSCFDLLAVVTNHSLTALIALLWLVGKFDVFPSWVDLSLRISIIFVGFSLFALLVMNFDRYLATSYPIFHRSSVTKGKLLTLLAILVITGLTLALMFLNDFVISYQVFLLIILIIIFPPMLLINCKLFIIARKYRRSNRITPKLKKAYSLKHISTCVLAVACFMVLSIPAFIYLGLRISSKGTLTLDNAHIAALWSDTICSMNGTFNCLIFFWKNKILRTEGMKTIGCLKVCQRVQSYTDNTDQDTKNRENGDNM